VRENFEISGFHLTDAEIAEINGLDQDKHLNYD